MRRTTWEGKLMRMGFVGGFLFSSLFMRGGVVFGDAASDKGGAAMLSHHFVTLAYGKTRSTAIPADLGAEEATILLRAAQRLEPGNVHTLKLLVEAAGAAGQTDAEREALRALIKADPGDLVAQVKYIDLLASGTQAIDERARTYQSAMDKGSLDAQIRSEMAVRLAKIAEERGDAAGAKGLLTKAIGLNDVNVRALREMVKLSDGGASERMGAIMALLTANPLEPDAWVEGSRVLAGVGMYGQGADSLTTGLEQIQLTGQQAGADMYLELAVDLAAAGRPVEAYAILNSLNKLPDAPMSVLVAAVLLGREYTPPFTGLATDLSSADLASRIEKMLTEGMKGKDVSAEALGDAVWVELAVLPTVGGETENWLKRYEEKVGADDAGLLRLKGWWLLRAGKMEEARGLLEKGAADGDVLSQLGLARVLMEEKKIAEGAAELRKLWGRNGGLGGGVLGFEVSQMARAGGMTLGDGAEAKAVGAALGKLPTTSYGAHRKMRDLMLLSTDFTQRNFELGDPITLHLKVSNTSDRAVPVGVDGLVNTTVGLSARSIGVDATNLGVYAIEDLQRVYRLERLAFIEDVIRVDQGPLAELMGGNPRQSFTVEMAVITAPRGSLKNTVPGLGGERIPLGVFERGGRGMGTESDLKDTLGEMKHVDLAGQMTRVLPLGVVMENLSDEQVRATQKVDEAPETTTSREAIRGTIVRGLTPYVKSDSALMRAWMVLNLPPDGLNELADVIAGMSGDADPSVRIAWGWRMSSSPAGMQLVKKAMAGEKDGLVREWYSALVKDATVQGMKGFTGDEGNGG